VAATGFALDPSRPLSSFAQRTWRSDDGLLQDSVTALLESKSGFLWIGTGAGLVQFDGATFDHHSRLNVPGFIHNRIQCLAEGPEDALWIGTAEPGLYLFQQGSVQTLGSAEGLPDSPIGHLLKDRRGTLWAAPLEGPLLRLDGARFQAMSSEAPRLRIRALIEDSEGRIWVGTDGSGLWRIQGDHLVLAALTSAEITALGTGPDGVLWVGTRTQGLLQLADGRLEAPVWARALPNRPILALLEDRAGSLWIGTDQKGLYRRTPAGTLEALPGFQGSHWAPQALLEDRTGALWTGSVGRGLRVLYPVPFRAIPLADGDPEEPVGMVCQDSQGSIWCLTGDQGLGLLHQGQIDRQALPKPGATPLSALWPRGAGGVWLGTRNGLVFSYYQKRLQELPSPAGRLTDAILTLYEDPGGILWAATPRQGLLRYAPGAAPLLFPAIKDIHAMVGGGPGPLFLGSRTQGLGVLEAGQVHWLGREEGLGSSGVESLHLDAEGTLWIGTLDGLRRYRDGRIEGFASPTGPLLLGIHAILEDAQHRMWFSTNQGVFSVPRTVLEAGTKATRPLLLALLDHHDGMPSRETYLGPQPAAWLTREGNLLIPTNRGLARMEQGSGMAPRAPLQIHFLKTESDETVLPDSLPILVPPGTHRFEIYYTAISLTGADKVRFRYRLEGLEKAWNEVGDHRFSAYSNLPPGSYRFTLQAWRLDEERPPQERSIEVRVMPFFFQRPAFWALCTLLVGGFGWWLLRLRLQQMKARSAVLLERNRMAREIHDHLAQGFTGVLLQLEAAEARLTRMQGDPEPVLTRLDHARNLAASSLQEARRSVMTLRPRKPEGTDLLGALRLLADRLLAGTDIQVELAQTGDPKPLPASVEEDLLRMAQELLTNALRHGKARWVRAELQFEPRRVRLSIEDDGLGFDPSAAASGYGMRSIRESLKQLRGHLDIDSSQGFGSRITITLPLRRWRL
jgi:signal transduction histidine kinase